MLKTVGAHGYGTYFFYGSFCFAIAVGAYFLVPETKGVSSCPSAVLIVGLNFKLTYTQKVSLERMDELFGVTDFSGIEDMGLAAQHAKGDIQAVHLEGQGK